MDLLGLNALNLDSVTFLVLDEADKMLQLGFEEQLDAVAKAVRGDRQTLLFSATFPERLRQAADRWMTFPEKVVIRVGAVDVGVESGMGEQAEGTKRPEEVEATSMASTLTVSRNITQLVHVCAQHKKNKKLVRFLDKIRQKEIDKDLWSSFSVIRFKRSSRWRVFCASKTIIVRPYTRAYHRRSVRMP